METERREIQHGAVAPLNKLWKQSTDFGFVLIHCLNFAQVFTQVCFSYVQIICKFPVGINCLAEQLPEYWG